MSALSFDVCREWFAKVYNKFANCFIRQIVPVSAAFLSVMLCGWFQFLELFHDGFPHVVVEWVQVWAVWWPGVLPCQ